MVGLVVLAEPIIALIYERGAFTTVDTSATAAALMFYAPGLLGYSAVKIASPTFYSLRDSRTPVVISVISVLTNLALNLALVRVMGYAGLALGTALAALFNAGALLWLLRRRIGGLGGRSLFIALAKITLASIVMGIVAAVATHGLAGIGGPGELQKGLRVFGAIGIAVVALAATARVLRIEEFDEAAARVMRRIVPGRP
jgi:putative peptidoglycan lipid II flippase